eukprot:350545-Chlamydomonas_euryale.AAC.4
MAPLLSAPLSETLPSARGVRCCREGLVSVTLVSASDTARAVPTGHAEGAEGATGPRRFSFHGRHAAAHLAPPPRAMLPRVATTARCSCGQVGGDDQERWRFYQHGTLDRASSSKITGAARPPAQVLLRRSRGTHLIYRRGAHALLEAGARAERVVANAAEKRRLEALERRGLRPNKGGGG